MTDFLRELEDALDHVQPGWDRPAADRALLRLQRRVRRRRARGVFAAALAVAVVAWPAYRLMRRQGTDAPAVAEAQGGSQGRAQGDAQGRAQVDKVVPAPRELTFLDGSTARLLDADTALTLVEDTPARTTASLERGIGQFEVQKRAGRLFRVNAGDVSIEVLGTAFTVDHAESAVGVWVSRGRVRVVWPGGSALLTAGDNAWFPSLGVTGKVLSPKMDEAPEAAGSSVPIPGAEIRRRVSANRVEGWQSLAERRRYSDAYALLKDIPPSKLRDPELLLTAADVARLSGHPDAAVAYFERVLTQHRSDSRAPVAAFSLGRILLYTLRRPEEAAARFAQARSLSPAGSLAEDALVREVEAWSRAGMPANARAGAEEYLKAYPTGRRAMAVRRYGGVD